MSAPVGKFTWLKAIYTDRFSDGQKAVLAYITNFSVFTGQDIFRVRQSTLAEQCGISRQTVGGAIRRARHLGYLTVVKPHTPGRTHHDADTLKLVLPAKSKASVHHSAWDASTAESCKANEANDVKQRDKWCKAGKASTSEDEAHYSSLNSSGNRSGDLGGGSRLDGAATTHTTQPQYSRPKTDSKALGDLLIDPRARSPKQRPPPQLEPEPSSGFTAKQQAAIEAARANLDRAQLQARQEEEGGGIT
jgi:hypothetical protein